MATMMKQVVLLMLAGVGICVGAGRPNVVFILADDMGTGDVRVLNPESKIATPNLDGLANAGMVFADAHSGSAVCTPTRYGVMTGRYCWRSRLKRGVLMGYSGHLIDPERVTVADVMAGAGYRTGVVGKWHLGLDWVKKDGGDEVDFTKRVGNHPGVYGFDASFLVPASLDMAPYVFVKDGMPMAVPTLEQPALDFPDYVRKGPRMEGFEMDTALDRIVAEARSFIADGAGREQPFFLYLPLTAPHKPVTPHARFRGKSGLGPYGDFVMQVDDSVGRVLGALDEAGVKDETLVVFTSDNGSFMYGLDDGEKDHVDDPRVQGFHRGHHRANGGLRGTKADVWEAGHRVPFFVRWPGVVKAGGRCAVAVCLTDFFATCADVVGRGEKVGEGEDSFSLVPLLEGREGDFKRAPVVNHSASGMFAVRDGKWKLVAGNGSGGREKPRGKVFEKPYQLFDLEADMGEVNNLAGEMRGRVKAMAGMLQGLMDRGGSR